MDLKLLLLYFSDSGHTGPVGEDAMHQAPRGRLHVLGVGKQNLPKSLSLSNTFFQVNKRHFSVWPTVLRVHSREKLPGLPELVCSAGCLQMCLLRDTSGGKEERGPVRSQLCPKSRAPQEPVCCALCRVLWTRSRPHVRDGWSSVSAATCPLQRSRGSRACGFPEPPRGSPQGRGSPVPRTLGTRMRPVWPSFQASRTASSLEQAALGRSSSPQSCAPVSS